MNIFEEPYPELGKLIQDCDKKIEELYIKLNDVSTKTLQELNSNGIPKSFKELGYTLNSKLKKKDEKNTEIKGLYVFGECDDTGKVIPKYVGISKTIFRRFRQHGWSKEHNKASLAYMKASQKQLHIGQRKHIKHEILEDQQKIIRNYKVAVLQVDNDYDLYFMEVYFAGKWKTEWNSFKTH